MDEDYQSSKEDDEGDFSAEDQENVQALVVVDQPENVQALAVEQDFSNHSDEI